MSIGRGRTRRPRSCQRLQHFVGVMGIVHPATNRVVDGRAEQRGDDSGRGFADAEAPYGHVPTLLNEWRLYRATVEHGAYL